jgi:hypothetical protein
MPLPPQQDLAVKNKIDCLFAEQLHYPLPERLMFVGIKQRLVYFFYFCFKLFPSIVPNKLICFVLPVNMRFKFRL